jgi:hypothetical protein
MKKKKPNISQENKRQLFHLPFKNYLEKNGKELRK